MDNQERTLEEHESFTEIQVSDGGFNDREYAETLSEHGEHVVYCHLLDSFIDPANHEPDEFCCECNLCGEEI